MRQSNFGVASPASRVTRLLSISVMAAAAACAAVSAHAQGMGEPGPQAGMMMFGGGQGHGHGHGMERMLDGIGATEAQRAQIKQIMQAAATDLKPQHEAGRALRDKGMQIFAAPTVDAAAAESVRQQMQAQHDLVSKRMLQAMLDASKVLTPEQRAKIAENMKNRADRTHDRAHDRMHGPALGGPAAKAKP